jgi:hypothetical protein
MKETVGPFPDPQVPSTDASGFMVPPWVKYPNIPRQSIGWRMGVGEQYLQEFVSWWSKQVRANRLALRDAYPEPEQWSGFFRSL